MSESVPATAELLPLPFVMVKIVTVYACAIEALAAASMEYLYHTTLHTSYENAINLACTLHSSKNLTDRFATLVTETEELMLAHDATITDDNALTTQVVQLKAQLMQTITLMTTATNSSSTGCKGQTNPEKFTMEDCSKLRSFVALLHLHLIDCPREFPNEQSKLRYVFSRLEGATLQQMIYLVKNDHVNLENFEAFVTSLEEAYRDPDHMNTAEWVLMKLR
jgi:hypothetical protein